jgi:uncharacterized membrane protein YphA (DoxX/SURF4 family)
MGLGEPHIARLPEATPTDALRVGTLDPCARRILLAELFRRLPFTGLLQRLILLTCLEPYEATFAEILLGLVLVLGFFTRVAALLSGLMLLVFALTMTFALGVKAPLNFSVFSSSAGASLLAAFGKYPLNIDALKSPRESLAE